MKTERINKKVKKKDSTTNRYFIIVLTIISNTWMFTTNILLSVQKSFIHPGKHRVHIPFVVLHGRLSKQFPLQFCIQSFPKVPVMQATIYKIKGLKGRNGVELKLI